MTTSLCRLTALLICSFLPVLTNAASCFDVLNNINRDINHAGAAIQQTRLPWKDLAWLKSHFNSPSIRRVSATATEYRWQCGQGNSLTALTNAAGKIAKLSGEFNSMQGAGIFSYVAPESDVTADASVMPPPAATVAPGNVQTTAEYYSAVMKANGRPGHPTQTDGTNAIPTHSLQPTIVVDKTVPQAAHAASEFLAPVMQDSKKDFHLWFNADLVSDEDVLKFVTHKTQAYYRQLRQCKPGSYAYPVLNPSLVMSGKPTLFYLATSIISGSHHGGCLVKTSVEMDGTLNKTLCHFSPDSLRYFTDEAGHVSLDPTSRSARADKKLKKVFKQCQVDPGEMAEVKSLSIKLAQSLKSCAPGKFNILKKANWTLYNPGPANYKKEKFIISGHKDGKCLVEIGGHEFGKAVHSSCAFSEASLHYLVKRLTGETGSMTRPDNQVHQANQQMLQECTTN